MKLDVERVILWSIIAVLIFMVFTQRRSGYMTLQANNISFFDLLEFQNSIDPAKLESYKKNSFRFTSFSNAWNSIQQSDPSLFMPPPALPPPKFFNDLNENLSKQLQDLTTQKDKETDTAKKVNLSNAISYKKDTQEMITRMNRETNNLVAKDKLKQEILKRPP